MDLQKKKEETAQLVISLLATEYPEPITLIHFSSVFELLVACILSAQTTDDQVNRVTPELFAQYPDAQALSQAQTAQLRILVRSTGFYQRKSELILAAAHYLMQQHQGKVPDTMDELLLIPGIGRKCASVVLSQGFHKAAIIVDRHFARVAHRLGLSSADISHPEKVEREIADIVPPAQWSQISMLLNYHGRYCCKSGAPNCLDCPLKDNCHFYAQEA